jgi:hypothetical protein
MDVHDGSLLQIKRDICQSMHEPSLDKSQTRDVLEICVPIDSVPAILENYRKLTRDKGHPINEKLIERFKELLSTQTHILLGILIEFIFIVQGYPAEVWSQKLNTK